MGKEYMGGSIRFSFTDTNTKEEIEKVVEVLKTSVEEIRKVMA